MFKNTVCRAALVGALFLLTPGHLALASVKKTAVKGTRKKTTPAKPAKPAKPAPVIDNRYQDIERLYTGMLSKKEIEKIESKVPPAPGSMGEFLAFFKAAFAKNPYSLPKLDRADLIFNLLGKLKMFNADKDPIRRTTVTSREVWENLETFTNTSRLSHRTVVGATKRTETIVGELIYTRMLLDPETDLALLKSRQQFIKLLVEDDDLFENLCHLVAQVAQEEESLVSLMLSSDSMHQNQILDSYGAVGIFGAKKAISGALNLHQFLQFLSLAFFGTIATVSSVATVKFALDFDGSTTSALRRGYKINRWFGRNNHSDQMIEQITTQQVQDLRAGSKYGFIKKLVPGALGLYGLLAAANTISLFGKLRREAQTAAYIRRRLSSVNVLFHALEALNTIPELQQVSELKYQSERYSDTSAIELEELERRLNKTKFTPPADGSIHSTFKTALSGQGDVANALIEAKKVMGKASDGLILLGHLDAYLSVAKLLRERKNSRAPYCFVEFLEGRQTPAIQATDFHHPVVKEDVVITNSLIVGGGNNPRNIMISGVNAGGKSTHMKAIALCCIFGQVFGIAPARSFMFTPFHLITTYLNITDDVSKQQSLFRAEITRAQELLRLVAALPSHWFSFVILDEVCTGTERMEGEALSFAISEKLGSYVNNILLLASHFPGLTKLEARRRGLYKNMKVIVEKDENGEFVYPYGLYEGTTNQQIAPDLLEKIGLPLVMTEKMRDVLNNPNRYVPAGE